MAPLVADMRSATAIDQEASTTNKIRLAALRTRTFCCKSERLIKKARESPLPFRSFWWGAAARSVASKAMSLVLPRAGRDMM